MILLGGLLLIGLPARAADVAIVVADPTSSGTTRVQVVAEGAMASRIGDPLVNLKVAPGAGTGRVQKATPLAQAGGGTLTYLVYDQSGSFKDHWSRAFTLSKAFVDALPSADHTVEVGTFGVTITKRGSATDAAALEALLKTTRANSESHAITRLHALIKDASGSASQALPLDRNGLRQVVVFTDLGEEGTFTAQDVVAEARGQGVRVHIVAFGASKATRTDSAKRLAEATGGLFVQAGDEAAARAALASIATAGARTWWLDVGFCDVPTGRGQEFEDAMTAEVWDGSRVAVSAPFPFRQRAEPATTGPCQAPVAPEPVVVPPVQVAPAEPVGLPSWLWGAAACVGLGLLGLLALPFLFAGRSRASDAPAPAPAPAPARPARAEVPDGPPGGHRDADVFAPVGPSLLDRLPTTRLERVSGPPSAPASVSIDRTRVALGAGPGNDVVLQADTVSGRHAHIELLANGDLWVTDDGSTNGTIVGGTRLEVGVRRKLVHGDTVGFGHGLVYRVSQPELAGRARPPDPDPPAPPPPEAPKPPRERARTTFRPVKPTGGGSS